MNLEAAMANLGQGLRGAHGVTPEAEVLAHQDVLGLQRGDHPLDEVRRGPLRDLRGEIDHAHLAGTGLRQPVNASFQRAQQGWGLVRGQDGQWMGPEGDDDDMTVRIKLLGLLDEGLVATVHTIKVSDDDGWRFFGNRHARHSMVTTAHDPNSTIITERRPP